MNYIYIISKEIARRGDRLFLIPYRIIKSKNKIIDKQHKHIIFLTDKLNTLEQIIKSRKNETYPFMITINSQRKEINKLRDKISQYEDIEMLKSINKVDIKA